MFKKGQRYLLTTAGGACHTSGVYQRYDKAKGVVILSDVVLLGDTGPIKDAQRQIYLGRGVMPVADEVGVPLAAVAQIIKQTEKE